MFVPIITRVKYLALNCNATRRHAKERPITPRFAHDAQAANYAVPHPFTAAIV